MNRQNTMEWLLVFVKKFHLSGGMRRMSISGHFGNVIRTGILLVEVRRFTHSQW